MSEDAIETIHPIALRYRACLLRIEHAVMDMCAHGEGDAPDNRSSDREEIARGLLRAVSTRSTMQAIAQGDIEPQRLTANRMHIHDVFGAPGSWGYGTALGDALRDLYDLDLKPLFNETLKAEG
jgi:hypothetical protein